MKGIIERWEKIRDLHFDKEGGSPYWIRKVEEYNLNPQQDLSSLEDFLMHEISLCDENELKRKPIEYFIPKRILERREFIPMTSSGSTGKKKNCPWMPETVKENAKHLSKILKLYGLKERMNWLITGPPAPAPFYYIIKELAEEMKSTLYFNPIETRGLKTYFSSINLRELNLENISDPFLKARVEPVLEYTLDILDKENIELLGTALFFLPHLEDKNGFENVKFVYVGGMEIPKHLYEFWKGKLESSGRKLITSYGHYMFGLIFDLPHKPLTYYPPASFSLLYVVDENNPFNIVGYGKRGRVKYLRVDEAMLWCQVERDYAERVPPNEHFNIDGVKEIKATF